MIFSETDAGKRSIEKQEANVAEGYNAPPLCSLRDKCFLFDT